MLKISKEVSQADQNVLTGAGADVYQRHTPARPAQLPALAEQLGAFLRREGENTVGSPQGDREGKPVEDQPGRQDQPQAKAFGFDIQPHLLHHNLHGISLAALHLYQLAAGAAFDQGQNGVEVQLPQQLAALKLGKRPIQLGCDTHQRKG